MFAWSLKFVIAGFGIKRVYTTAEYTDIFQFTLQPSTQTYSSLFKQQVCSKQNRYIVKKILKRENFKIQNIK